MNQKTAKLIRKFVNKSFADKPNAERRQVYQKFKKTYKTQTDVERAKLKGDMRNTLAED
jgi:hypothetical protein